MKHPTKQKIEFKVTQNKTFKVGCKDDCGKPRMELIDPDFLTGIAQVLSYGEDRYGFENWQKNLASRRIYGALLRHANAYRKGEIYDSDTGLDHMLHVAVNAMFLFWYNQKTVELRKQQTIRKQKETAP